MKLAKMALMTAVLAASLLGGRPTFAAGDGPAPMGQPGTVVFEVESVGTAESPYGNEGDDLAAQTETSALRPKATDVTLKRGIMD